LDIRILRSGQELDEYYNADAIVSTGGDTLDEYFGMLCFLQNAINVLFGLLLGKPIVLYAESIGPFRHWWNRSIARFLLNRAKLITVIEEISRRYLAELGISKSWIYSAADSAFALDSAPAPRVREILEKVSKLIPRYGFPTLSTYKDKYDRYIEMMAKLIDHLIEDLNATVVLIPHATGARNDDRIAAEDACKLINNRRRVIVVRNEHTPKETKGIIGQCDLLIGARMHATTASTSMGVPTVAIAFSQKTHGIPGEMLGFERYVLDIRKNFNAHDLILAVDDAWSKRAEIRKELESKMEGIRQRALLNAALVKELVERERRG